MDFYAFWGFLEVTGFSFEIPEGVQAGVTMKAGCLCFHLLAQVLNRRDSR